MTPINKAFATGLTVFTSLSLLAGCTQRFGDFTLISTRNVDLSNAVVDVRAGQRVTEEDCALTLLIFPLGRPDLETAVDNALQSGRGNIMVDQVSYRRWWYVPLLVGQECVVAEGTVVNVATPNKLPARPL
jgi:hypothetical protein